MHKSNSDVLPPLAVPSASPPVLTSSTLSSDRISSLAHSTSSSTMLPRAPALIKQQSVLHKPTAGAAQTALSPEEQRVVEDFRKRVASSPNTAIAVCAIQALTGVVRQSSSTTMMGLEIELNTAVNALKACNPASISLAAGCELFSRYVTRASLDIPRFEGELRHHTMEHRLVAFSRIAHLSAHRCSLTHQTASSDCWNEVSSSR
jgi:hypothetical protein